MRGRSIASVSRSSTRNGGSNSTVEWCLSDLQRASVHAADTGDDDLPVGCKGGIRRQSAGQCCQKFRKTGQGASSVGLEGIDEENLQLALEERTWLGNCCSSPNFSEPVTPPLVWVFFQKERQEEGRMG